VLSLSSNRLYPSSLTVLVFTSVAMPDALHIVAQSHSLVIAHRNCAACVINGASHRNKPSESLNECVLCARKFCNVHCESLKLSPRVVPNKAADVHACQECAVTLKEMLMRAIHQDKLARLAKGQMSWNFSRLNQAFAAPERHSQCIDCLASASANCTLCGLAVCKFHQKLQTMSAGAKCLKYMLTCSRCVDLATARAAARTYRRALVGAVFRNSLTQLHFGTVAPLEEVSDCADCGRTFEHPVALRHHCRICGLSLCASCLCGRSNCLSAASARCELKCPHTACVPRNGYAKVQRVCHRCLPTGNARVAARDVIRIVGKTALSYVGHCHQLQSIIADPSQSTFIQTEEEDTWQMKVSRATGFVITGACHVVPMVIGLPWQAGASVQAADRLWNYGRHGVLSLLARGDIAQALNNIRELNRKLPQLEPRDLLVGGLYLSAEHRRRLRDDPAQAADEVARYGGRAVPSQFLESLIKLSVLALNLPFHASPSDVQRLACQQRWRLASCRLGNVGIHDESWRRQPAWCLFIRRDERLAVISIRGTAPEDSHGCDVLTNVDAKPAVVRGFDGKTMCAHRGMLSVARALERELRQTLRALAAANFQITFTGHSLGGALAALLVWLVRHGADGERLPCETHTQGIGYGVPCVMDNATAMALQSSFTSVANAMDVVSRLHVDAVAQLGSELNVCASESAADLDQDVQDFVARLKSVWAPRVRSNGNHATVADSDEHTVKVQEDVTGAIQDPQRCDDGDGDAGLFIPGSVIWIHRVHGHLEAAFVPCDLPALRRIILDKRMVTDHMEIREALLDVHARQALGQHARSVKWQAFRQAAASCVSCGNDYAWMCTGRSRKQRSACMTNCRSCGRVVCCECASQRRALPDIGILEAARICDTCAWHGPGHQPTL